MSTIRLILSDSTRRSVKSTNVRGWHEIELTVDEEKEDVFLCSHGVRLGQKEVDAHFEHVPVLEDSEGLLSHIVDAVVSMQNVSPNFVQLINDLVLCQRFGIIIIAISHASQASRPGYSMCGHIGALIFHLLASELDEWVMHTVAGYNIHNFLVFFVATQRFAPLF